MRTITLGEMLGPELVEWVYQQYAEGTLTNGILREKLEQNRQLLADRGIDSGYAYYAVLYALAKAAKTGEEGHQ